MLLHNKKSYMTPTFILLYTEYYIQYDPHGKQRETILTRLHVYSLLQKYLSNLYLAMTVSFDSTITIFRPRGVKYRHTDTNRARLSRKVYFCLFILYKFQNYFTDSEQNWDDDIISI
jgi:hypothetical protein